MPLLIEIWIVEPFQNLICIGNSVESHCIVHILSYPAPAPVLRSGSPHDNVVTREIEVAIIQIHDHHIDELTTVHPLLVFGHRMKILMVEIRKTVQVIPITRFVVIPVLKHIDIL